MVDTLETLSGNGQAVEPGEPFAPLAVQVLEQGSPVGGAVVSYFVQDAQATGTDFHGGSPVRVTTAVDGTAVTDVPLIAGGSPGSVLVEAVADGSRCSFDITVR
ncbi:hypothetical protein [Streptomyces sp. NPDC057257]|uniref:hypothetical protein n=1 Tax=Streptomyces sp. NPDC057257 TaxID=3346071 RepID=UPI00363A95B1